MMRRRGQGLSLTTIVVAVLVLIVLIVLVVIFSGRVGKFSEQTGETQNQFLGDVCDIPGTGRYCAGSCEPGDSRISISDFKCNDKSRGIALCCQK